MKNILIVYSSVDGQTKKICSYMHQKLLSIADSTEVTIEIIQLETLMSELIIDDSKLIECNTLILGASVRYGKHRDNIKQFIMTYKNQLVTTYTTFFSVNLVARKIEKNTANTNPYITKLLTELNWQPDIIDVFAGKLDYALYGFFDKIMIQLIMWITKGPTSSNTPIEFTDWKRVDKCIELLIKNTTMKI